MTTFSRRSLIATLAASMASACAPSARRPVAAIPTSPPQPARPWAEPIRSGSDTVIDLSHHNRVDDFTAARAASGILAVIHKASEGVGWTDPVYPQRREAARAAGLLWGAYHFGTRQYSGAEQAAAFLAAARPGPETLLALDLELNERNPGNSMDLSRAEAFVQTVLEATGRLPLLYVHPTWASGRPMGSAGRSLGGAITGRSILSACDLWLADYRTTPDLPAAWTGRGWRFWQYAGDSDGRNGGPFRANARAVAGIDRCDRNLFAHGPDHLPTYWAGGVRLG